MDWGALGQIDDSKIDDSGVQLSARIRSVVDEELRRCTLARVLCPEAGLDPGRPGIEIR